MTHVVNCQLEQKYIYLISGIFESPKELTDFEGSIVIRCHQRNSSGNKIVVTVFVTKWLTKAVLQNAMAHAE